MTELHFLEVQTPKIVAEGLNGGAATFRFSYYGHEVGLRQSAQLHKQMAVAAFERVFEVGPVFRAEPFADTKHLSEYTALDFELAFVESDHELMDIHERIVRGIYDELLMSRQRELSLLGRSLPAPQRIPRLPYDQVLELARHAGASPPKRATNLRLGKVVRNEWNADWYFVHDFPLAGLPFYTEAATDEPTRARRYILYCGDDIVAGGGMRIHDAEKLRRRMLEYQLDEANFESYLRAFDAGMPPHGGGSQSLEGTTSVVLGLANIREAALFPRDSRRARP